MQQLPKFSTLKDQQLKKILQENKIGLTVEEAREVEKSLGRTPTLTEAIVWGIQGSEHCSYKSSRKYLKLLPTKAPNVILGPGEDSGIVEITKVAGEGKDRYGIVISHESHNHPSQIVPYEGAATGIGGCVRDVACMGAKVIATMDPLRLGDINKNESRQVANGVVSGIGGYGNPIGVPSIGGDAYFESGFNDNCLVNVVSLGLIRESQIIHSYVSPDAAKEEWDIIIVGKPTDMSGMGGAAFASLVLDESEKEKNKGAVQEPNPFLKRHLLVSSYDLFKELQKKKMLHKVSFKDMGAGGITCSTVEQVAKVGLGVQIDLDKVNIAIENLDPSIIACAETQERFTWMCHPSLTKLILDHYNKKWELPNIAENAGAFLIGKVKTGNYVQRYRGEVIVDAPSKLMTEGLLYDRPFKESKTKLQEPNLPAPKDYEKILLQLLSSENIACRKPIYERYDKQVQGYVVIEAGEADAGVMVPLLDENVDAKTKKIGMAFATDGNPRYGLISPFHGAANAVIESMRNVAAVGAYPQALTNCLNYGNPEKPNQMWEIIEGIKGIAAACDGVKLKNYPTFATPILGGNVSLYNESKNGHVPPSAIICCIGKIDDAYKAVTTQLKKPGSKLFLLGERKDELGGSEYYRLFDSLGDLRKIDTMADSSTGVRDGLVGLLGANVPVADFAQAQKEIYTMVDAAAAGVINAAHDISEGGLAITLAEMAIGGRGEGEIGIEVNLDSVKIIDQAMNSAQEKERTAKTVQQVTGELAKTADVIKLFSQTGGFVVEIEPAKVEKFLQICTENKLKVYEIGKTVATTDRNSKPAEIIFKSGGKTLINLPLKKAAESWLNGLREKL